jgi:toxin ParE1/3/4
LKLLWSLAALRHLREAHEYIKFDNPSAAARQIELIEANVNHLRAFPMIGRTGRRAGTRELPISDTPYIVVYRLKEESVQILAVLHGSRSWK